MKELCPRKDAPLSGVPTQVGTFDCRVGTFVKPKETCLVSGVIPTLGVSIKFGSFDCREFRPKSGLPTDLIKTLFGSGLLDSDPNCSKLIENLKNKS